MTYGSTACRSAGDSRSDLADVADDVCRIGTYSRKVFDTDWGVAVEVFAANRYASNEVGEVRPVLLDGAGEGYHFVVEISLTC